MGKKHRTLVIISVLIFLTAVFAMYLLIAHLPRNPLAETRQIVLVVSKTASSHDAMLYTYERDSDSDNWRFRFSCPAVIGKNGLAWGRGLHRDTVRVEGEPVKAEGDNCSPQGVFALTGVYGTYQPSMMRIRFPYTQITEDMACIDDVRSEYYNMIVSGAEAGLESDNPPSHEDMLRDDGLYDLVVFVAHNSPDPKPGAGSCIFLHIWEGPGTYTAGCTAMARENIIRLAGWLDPESRPLLVQLSRKNYRRLRDIWGLPEVKI